MAKKKLSALELKLKKLATLAMAKFATKEELDSDNILDLIHNKSLTASLRDMEARLDDELEDITLLQEAYRGLTETDVIPCTSLPATGQPNKIYRLAGSGSYTDYMYAADALTTPIPMATFDNGIATESDVRNIVRNYMPSA